MKITKITLSNLYKGLPFVNKTDTYKKPQDYVKPFLDNFKTKFYKLNIYVEPSKETYIYNKILVQVIIPKSKFISIAFNLTLAFNKAVPVYKVYKSYFIDDVEYVTNNCEFKIGKIKDFNLNFIDFNNNTIEAFKNDTLTLEKINNKIPKWLYNIRNSVSNNGLEYIQLSSKIITSLYTKLNLKNEIFYKLELYKILYNDIIKNSKDLSNRFEKFQLIQNIYENS